MVQRQIQSVSGVGVADVRHSAELCKSSEVFALTGRRIDTVVLVGPPGAGKGTVAANLVNALSIREPDRYVVHLSTGDLVRNFGTSEQRENVARGRFTPDFVIIRMLADALRAISATAQGVGKTPFILLDGFPRTAAQTDWLCRQTNVWAYVVLEISKDTAVARLSGRMVDAQTGATYGAHPSLVPPKGARLVSRPEDQDVDRWNRRYDDYFDKTVPAVLALAARSRTHGSPLRHGIDATRSPDRVAHDALGCIGYHFDVRYRRPASPKTL